MKPTKVAAICVLFVTVSIMLAASDAGRYEAIDNLVSATSITPGNAPIPGYLIIYAHDFRPEINPALQDFIDWKLKKGLNVYTVDQNVLNIQGTPDDVYIVKECIEWWYNSTHCNPEAPANYVLLIGDAPPWNPNLDTPYCYLECQKGDNSHVPIYVGWDYFELSDYPPIKIHQGRIYSDYYYQLLEGDDLFPDICLGRWCPRDSDDLNTFTNKTLTYEKPFSDPYTAYLWDCEEVLFVAPKGSKEDSVYIWCKQEIEGILPTPIQYDLETLYGDSACARWVMEQIEQDTGIGIINYRGHGSWYRWASVLLDTGEVYALQNYPCCPIVYNICCANGCITASDTNTYPNEVQVMVEAWTRSPNGGAVATLGASRKSWPDENDQFDYEIFRSHYQDTFNCGRAINAGKISMLTTPGLDSARADENVKMYNWIGDPELDVWRYQPQECEFLFFNDPEHPDKIAVTVWKIIEQTPLPGSRICLYREGGGHHRLTYTNENGVAHFSYPSLLGTYHLTATNQWGGPALEECMIPVCSSFVWTGTWTWPMSSGASEVLPELTEWQLKPIYPNPMRTQATISYSVGGTVSANLKITVYDASGRLLKALASGEHAPGHYEITWDGRNNSGVELPSGVYFVRMQTNTFKANQRLVLIR